MIDPLRASYDALPYRHGAVALSQPARMGAVGRLLGLAAAAPERCRVLELGCGEGMNLLPLAERFPSGTFVGVDFSSTQIAVAEQARAAAGLGNVRLVCADLRAFAPERAGFDYVIAHGVYSWVPADVRERLLAVCAEALAPHGLAYVSYNTQPSGGVLSGLRAVLVRELAGVEEPGAQCAKLGQLLRALGQAFAAQPGPYAELMRELIAEMAAKPAQFVLHDELGIYNEPSTFLDFVAHADRHGLHFLSEAHFASMPFEHLPAAAREPLGDLALDAFREQQYLDLLGNRRFRAALLCRENLPHPRVAEAAAIRKCALATRLQLERPEVDLRPGQHIHLSGGHGVKFSVEDPAQKAFLAILIASAPERIPFAQAVADAAAALGQSGLAVLANEELLAQLVVRLFAVDQVDLFLAGDGAWLASHTAGPSALMRHQATTGLAVVNRWHENVELDAEQRRRLSAGETAGALEMWRDGGLVV